MACSFAAAWNPELHLTKRDVVPFCVARFHLDVVALASASKSAESKTWLLARYFRVISLKAEPYEIKQRDACVARCN